jgi:hypothetical protein
VAVATLLADYAGLMWFILQRKRIIELMVGESVYYRRKIRATEVLDEAEDSEDV